MATIATSAPAITSDTLEKVERIMSEGPPGQRRDTTQGICWNLTS
jgi:hypothetical protein